jgi:excisionase family DNA binding protein
MHYLTTTEAAAILQVIPRRVRALIESGKLPAERIGRDWVIKPKDLDRLKGRTPGRPRKEQ